MQVFFILGLFIGSFLGVIIDRLPHALPVVLDRSHCETCNRNLTAIDLVPVLSFVFLGGKCRMCHTELSFRYPLIEILTGITYSLTYLKFGFSLEFIFALFFISILIVISFIDLDTMIIYDRFHILIIIIGLLEIVFLKKKISNHIIASLIVSIPYLLIAVLTGGMGGGDIKLMFSSGIYLGIQKTLVAFVISIILGGFYGIYTLIIKKHSRKDPIPFGPFICIGLFISLLYGLEISKWYLSLIS